MSTEQGVDKRVIKTKKAIRSAFAELLSEKDVSAITIKDISDRAIINRKTFYSYYQGVYQLIDEIEDEVVSSLSTALIGEDLSDVMRNPYSLFRKLTAIINSDLGFYGFLMQRGHNTNLASKIIDELKKLLKESYLEESGVNETLFDLYLDFVFAGTIFVYQNWFNSDRKQSIEMISESISTIIFSGLGGLKQ